MNIGMCDLVGLATTMVLPTVVSYITQYHIRNKNTYKMYGDLYSVLNYVLANKRGTFVILAVIRTHVRMDIIASIVTGVYP